MQTGLPRETARGQKHSDPDVLHASHTKQPIAGKLSMVYPQVGLGFHSYTCGRKGIPHTMVMVHGSGHCRSASAGNDCCHVRESFPKLGQWSCPWSWQVHFAFRQTLTFITFGVQTKQFHYRLHTLKQATVVNRREIWGNAIGRSHICCSIVD